MKNYFLVGICGASMSSLAIYLKQQGFCVRGYDRNSLGILTECGIEVSNSENLEDIEWADEIVYSSAFDESFSLLAHAKKLGKKLSVRGKLLAEIAGQHEKVVAISGSHGKSSVTAMVYNILRVAGFKPSLHVGANLKESGRSFDFAGKEFFVTEACEYHDNFLFLRPFLSVVTNVEPEHLDYFGTFKNELKSFDKFKESSLNVVENTNLEIRNLKTGRRGDIVFDVLERGARLFNLRMAVGGKYNAKNALLAIEVCRKLGVSDCLIKLGLENYKGLEKRFERVGCAAPGRAIVDYAHHPHEIASVVDSLKGMHGNKVAIFQPHTYSRTATLMHEFVKALSEFDEVILFKTYAAREQPQPEIEIELLKKLAAHTETIMFYDLNALIDKLNSFEKGAILAIMGAGDLPEKLFSRKFIWRD